MCIYYNIYLVFPVPPDILDDSTSTDMMVNEGSNVTLRCAAIGTPRPTITWRREAGGSISSQEGTKIRIFYFFFFKVHQPINCHVSRRSSCERRGFAAGNNARQPAAHGSLSVHRFERCTADSQQANCPHCPLYVYIYIHNALLSRVLSPLVAMPNPLIRSNLSSPSPTKGELYYSPPLVLYANLRGCRGRSFEIVWARVGRLI